MKIYVTTQGYDYEGEDVIGVFDTQDKADAYIEKRRRDQSWSGPDFYHVYEFSINSTDGTGLIVTTKVRP